MEVALRLHEFCRNPLHPGPCKGWKKAKAAGLDTSIMHGDLASPRRPRKKKPTAAPVAPPAPPEPDLEEEARERQEEIDLARGRAEVLAELEERALINEESDPDVLRRALEQVAQRAGVADEPAIRDVIEAAAWEPRDLSDAIRYAAMQYGLDRIGGVQGRSLQRLPFNPKEHKSIDGPRKPKERVQLVRPGYYGDINGERVLLEKALVEEADEDYPTAAGGDADWQARLASGEVSRRGLSNSDNYSKVDLVTFGDGSKAIHKTGKVWPGGNWPKSMTQEHDAEELAVLVAEELGLRPPGIYRATPDDAYFDYIPDGQATLAMEKIGWGQEPPSSYVESMDGRRMGLLDVLTENRDRNPGNWFVDNADETHLIPIDHGLSWEAPAGDDPRTAKSTGNPFTEHYIDDQSKWLPDAPVAWSENDLSPAYVADLRARLANLKPEFDRLGRGRWHGRMMERLDMIEQNATGGVFL